MSVGTWLIALSLVLSLSSCGNSASGVGAAEPAPSDSKDSGSAQEEASTNADIHRVLLQRLAEDVFLAQCTDFDAAAASLESATEKYAASASDDDRVAAQEAWVVASLSWQQIELMQVGPAGLMDVVAGGKSIRDEIYSWPLTNHCRIDQETVEDVHEDPVALAKEALNVRGLDAMEYLLFPIAGNSCNAKSSINKEGTWDALTEAELATRRATYAHSLAVLVRQQAATLLSAWISDGGDFVAELAGAGNGSALYVSAQAGLNAISDAMFYLDKMTKDMKIAEPIGVSGCDEEICPEELESRFGARSKGFIISNLKGFQKVFNGAGEDGTGFDDLLISVGANELATTMTADISAAIVAVEGIEGTLNEALTKNPDQVLEAYNAVKRVTDMLKTQFVSVLDLEIPSRAASDND